MRPFRKIELLIMTFVPGATFTTTEVKLEDLRAGKLDVELPAVGHTSMGDEGEKLQMLIKGAYIGILTTSVEGAWDVSTELNEAFPDHQFKDAEKYLEGVWTGRA
jgi:hypothetical protein